METETILAELSKINSRLDEICDRLEMIALDMTSCKETLARNAKCDCKGIIKPDVVLYGEMLDNNTLNTSIKLIENCDMLIIAGTSLLVEPASSLIRYFKGNYLVILNRSNTKYCDIASLVINDSLGNIFKQLK